MKIIFFGSFQYAVPALEQLVKAGYKIVTVVTNPDSTQGRRKELTPTPVKLAAKKFGLSIFQPEKIRNNPDILQIFGKSDIHPLEDSRAISRRPSDEQGSGEPSRTNPGSRVGRMADLPDLGVIVAYSKILPKEIIELPKYGTINIHPSLLPAYRGPSPIQSAILNGETETGVTIMQVDEEVDHGPILSQAKYQISSDAYHPQVAMEIFQLGAKLLIKTIPDWLERKIIPKPQDHFRATFTKKFTWQDGRIDWHQPAEKIYNQIRALNPEPGTWTIFNGKILKILKAKIGGNGKIIPQEVQLEGKKVMLAQDFLRGVSKKELDFE